MDKVAQVAAANPTAPVPQQNQQTSTGTQEQVQPLGGYNAVQGPTLGAQIANRQSSFAPIQAPAAAPNSTSGPTKDNMTAIPKSLAMRDNAKIRANGALGGPYK